MTQEGATVVEEAGDAKPTRHRRLEGLPHPSLQTPVTWHQKGFVSPTDPLPRQRGLCIYESTCAAPSVSRTVWNN